MFATSTRFPAEVIEISDDEEEDTSFPLPPAKRHKSTTPFENHSSLDKLPNGSRDPRSGPSSSAANSGSNSRPLTPPHPPSATTKGVRSPFKSLSRISYPDGQLRVNGDHALGTSQSKTKASPSPSPASKTIVDLDDEARNLLEKFRGKPKQSSSRSPSPTPVVHGKDGKQRQLLAGDTDKRRHQPDRYSTPIKDDLNHLNHNTQQGTVLSTPSSQKLISVDIPIRPTSGSTPTPGPDRTIDVALNKQLSLPLTSRRDVSKPSEYGSSQKHQSDLVFPSSHHRPDPVRQNFEIVIPRTAASSQSSANTVTIDKKLLLAELKKSTAPAEQRLADVERLFGQTGFSKTFSVEPDLDRMRKLASKKKRTKHDLSKVSPEEMCLVTDGGLAESFSQLSVTDTATVTSLVVADTAKELRKNNKRTKHKRLVSPWTASSIILTNRFNEKVNPPLTFANDVNESRLHGKFQFTDRYIIRSGIKMAPTSNNYGCRCISGQCSLETCQCLTKEITNDSGKFQHLEQKRTYVRRPDGIVVLSDQYIEQELDPEAKHYEISECNEFCSCGPDCWNRVVSRGRTVPLEVFQTKKCGFGVRSSVDIVKGQFIELYLGEVITEAELLRREDKADENESSYIYSLDWFASDKNYHIDGAYFGSAMRFVNHSCNPNTRCFTVQKHKNDKKVYYLAFFAIKNIKAGVEIRIDYSGAGGVDEDELEAAADADGHLPEDVVRCQCGEKKCRKMLWAPGVKARNRRRRRRGGD